MNYMDAYDELRRKKAIDYSLSYNKDKQNAKLFQNINIDELYGCLNEYPNGNYQNIKAMLKKKFPQERFVVGSGSEDLLWRINTFLLKGKRTGVVVPSFYRTYQTIQNPYLIKMPFEISGYHYPKEELDEALETYNLDAIWIGNPNPIVGKAFLAKDIFSLVEKWPKVLFIVDEASVDSILEIEKYSLMVHKHHYQNLIILRTFSKFYGLPGMRFGYAALNQHFADILEQEGQVFPVSGFNYIVAKEIFSRDNYFYGIKVKIQENKRKLAGLIAENQEFYLCDSLANTVVLGHKSESISLWKVLKENGILSFSLEEEEGMEGINGVRLTVDSGEESFQYLYERIRNVIRNPQLSESLLTT